MSKFNIGDEVIILNNVPYGFYGDGMDKCLGKRGTVIHINNAGFYLVSVKIDSCEYNYYWSGKDLVLSLSNKQIKWSSESPKEIGLYLVSVKDKPTYAIQVRKVTYFNREEFELCGGTYSSWTDVKSLKSPVLWYGPISYPNHNEEIEKR